MKIAILGATSHIAKGLINNFFNYQDYSLQLYLYSRSTEKAQSFLDGLKKEVSHFSLINNYNNFYNYDYDIIINCVGVGTMKQSPHVYSDWFMVTETYDNLVLDYLQKGHQYALYISLSSGAIYGDDFSSPAHTDSIRTIKVNQLTYKDYYSIARLNAEAKHRSFDKLNIIDLRIFSYFSRFIDLSDSYFITDLLNCIIKNEVFITSQANIARDYLSSKDLFQMIGILIKRWKRRSLQEKNSTSVNLNMAIDLSSASPIDKIGLLEFFSQTYNLKYKYSNLSPKEISNSELPIDRQLEMKTLNLKDLRPSNLNPTGEKINYYTLNKGAGELGFRPLLSGLDNIKHEVKYILY